jgi:hypothetical protein
MSCEEDPKISKSQEDFNLKVFGGASTDICNAIQYDGDNIYLTGSIENENSPDMFLIKTDNFGNEVSWSPLFFGSSGNDAGHDIAIDRNQNVLVAGYQFMPSRGDTDVLVSKVNPNGEVLWTKTFGGPKEEMASAINVSSANKILVAGYTESINFAVKQRQGWLLELSENGDSLWSSDYGTSYVPDELKDILELEDSYLLVGNTTTSFGSNKKDAFVFIINKVTKGIQNSQFLYKSGNDFGVSAIQLLTRDFVIVGYTQVNNTVNNIILWKLNEDLQTLTMKQIESSVSEVPSSVNYVDGSIVIVGTVAKEQNNDDYLVYTLNTDLSVTSRNQYGSKGNQRGMAGAIIGKSVVIGGCTTSGNSSKASIFKTPAILP